MKVEIQYYILGFFNVMHLKVLNHIFKKLKMFPNIPFNSSIKIKNSKKSHLENNPRAPQNRLAHNRKSQYQLFFLKQIPQNFSEVRNGGRIGDNKFQNFHTTNSLELSISLLSKFRTKINLWLLRTPSSVVFFVGEDEPGVFSFELPA